MPPRNSISFFVGTYSTRKSAKKNSNILSKLSASSVSRLYRIKKIDPLPCLTRSQEAIHCVLLLIWKLSSRGPKPENRAHENVFFRKRPEEQETQPEPDSTSPAHDGARTAVPGIRFVCHSTFTATMFVPFVVVVSRGRCDADCTGCRWRQPAQG